jgi:hypothetical protein
MFALIFSSLGLGLRGGVAFFPLGMTIQISYFTIHYIATSRGLQEAFDWSGQNLFWVHPYFAS